MNGLLLALAVVSYVLGDQRAAIVIAVMVLLSVSLGFVQEHRSNKAADDLRRMVLTKATLCGEERAWRNTSIFGSSRSSPATSFCCPPLT